MFSPTKDRSSVVVIYAEADLAVKEVKRRLAGQFAALRVPAHSQQGIATQEAFRMSEYRVREKSGGWCGRVDSNHHGIATASPSSWCVCQFRHDRAVKFYR
jgi:hypothetical protein